MDTVVIVMNQTLALLLMTAKQELQTKELCKIPAGRVTGTQGNTLGESGCFRKGMGSYKMTDVHYMQG